MLRVGADRRVAGGVERVDQRPLGGQATSASAVGDRARPARPRASSSRARLERQAALARARASASAAGRAAAPSSRPSRRRPASASTIASKRPSASRRRRVSTLPRRSRTSRSGRRGQQLGAAAQAAGADAAPSGSSSSDAAPHERVARVRALGHADDREPSGSSPGTSLAECTARSTSPASSASSISLTKRDLSPTVALRRGRPRCVISTSSTSRVEQRRHVPRLRQRERAAARAEPDASAAWPAAALVERA